MYKQNQKETISVGALPVKKFKIENIDPAELPFVVDAFNLTISNGQYNLDEMEVTNK